MNGCLSWAPFSQILHKALHPTPKLSMALINWQNCQEFAALLCYYLGRPQEDAKCCSGPIASLKYFSSVLDLRPHRDIRRLHEQTFYWVSGKEEGEWCQAKDTALAVFTLWVGQEEGHRRIGSHASLPEGCLTGKKRTGKWGCWATSSKMTVSFVELRQGYSIFSTLQLQKWGRSLWHNIGVLKRVMVNLFDGPKITPYLETWETCKESPYFASEYYKLYLEKEYLGKCSWVITLCAPYTVQWKIVFYGFF